MTEKENPTTNAEFSFVVIKQADGRIAIGPAEGGREPTIDDIYSAIAVIQRDIQVQQSVAGVVGVLQQLTSQQPQQTPGGIVVPEPTSKFKKVTRS